MSDAETYRRLYVVESRENHDIIVKSLLELEEGTCETAIDEIFRACHTLKGMSASMGFLGMERLCHAMEDVFQLIRNGDLEVNQKLIDLLLTCTDLLEEFLDEVEGGGDGESKAPDALIAALCEWNGQKGTRGPDVQHHQRCDTVIPDSGEAGGGERCGSPGSPAGIYSVSLALDHGCTTKDLRAILVLQNLEELGTITSTSPPRQQIEDGEFDGRFSLTIASDAGADALHAAASGTEIAEVIVSAAAADRSSELSPTARVQPPEKAEKQREVKSIRVDIRRLDTMMNLVEDLVINRGRLKQIAGKHQIKELDEALNMASRSIADLQSLMMSVRMIPLNHIFNRFPRVVRDVAHHDGKEVEFTIEGGETELDRSIMDGLSDPLLHLIRNAVNHGIEPPHVREGRGKQKKGELRLSARRDRENVILVVEDDGAGIDEEKVRKKAIEKGILSREEAPALSREAVIDLLFEPGFSTADTVTDISGRGVGLDVVRSAIESLKGTIRVKSVPGRGTTFQLVLPPTMAIVEVMMVRINGRRCSIPISNIVEVATLKIDSLYHIGGREAVMLRGEVLPLYRLEDMFGSSETRDIVVVLQHQNRKCCITVDMVEGQQEVVIKPLNNIFGNCRGISGVTIPGDGEVIPVLDISTLI
jgi:two-component system, chemotaxis family, sensor kinase CheA